MKKIIVMIVLSLMVISLFSADLAVTPQQRQTSQLISTQTGESVRLNQNNSTNSRGREETIFYVEDFEDGLGGWESVDGTMPAAMWHLSDWNPYGGTGYSWWMGDPEIGGYRNSQYVVLDTPEILVTAANSTLTFKLNYNVEEPGGEPPGYDGWDGCNVRISTDGGNSWTVISGTPAYTSTSMYSFGHEHSEGQGIPGWGASSDGWVDASFDLASYVGQDVKIRFAFASDPAYDTTNNPEMFGMKVDNISLGGFDHDFNDGNEQGMTYTSVVPVGGDLWHVATTTPLPPSPPNAAVCQNDQGTYNPGMLNYFVSPPITLPGSGDIRVDFMIKGDIDSDTNAFPDTDYWGWEISPDGGTVWYAMSNPYNVPGGNNYVYLTPDTMWGSVTALYSLDGYISDYAGQTVKFRIYLKTNDATPVGEGIMIDDYTIYHSEYLPVPTGLVAEVADQSVNLSWNAPGSGGEEGWIHWDDGTNNDGIGLQDGGSVDVAAKFTPPDLEPYVNGHITTLRFFPREAASSYDLKIWTGPSGGTLVYEQELTAVVADQWNEIVLDEPVLIGMGLDYWIGYTAEHSPGQWPAGCDAGPHVPGKGDMIRTGASWTSLYNASSGTIDVNWNIQALVEILDTRTGVTITENLAQRDVTGFNVYHSTTSGSDYELIATVDEEEYVHNNPAGGMVNYYVVTALYDVSESGYSNQASAFVMPATATEFAYDDGVADSGYNAGVNNHVAVRFIPGFEGETELTHIKVYIHTLRTGAMVVKVWEDDQGLPGSLLSQFVYPATQVNEGWNIIPMPPANPVYFTDGYFFVGIQESATASGIGVDENTVTSSFTKIGANPWTRFLTGNFMIRAILDGPTNVEELIPDVERLSISNYPNPFNPETKIALTLPQDSPVSINIYNTKGQLVTTLVDEFLPAGSHTFNWSGQDNRGAGVASGVYFYRLETDDRSITKRMLLLK